MWGKKELKIIPFWTRVYNRLPITNGYYDHNGWWIQCNACFISLLGKVPNGADEIFKQKNCSDSHYPHPKDTVISYLKSRPDLLKDIQIAISDELIQPIPIDVVVARKHLSKMGVELGLLGFDEVYKSIEVLVKYVEGLENANSDG